MAVTLMSVPVGTIIDYAGSGTPEGYLSCEGQAVSRTTYARLFDAIGTAWGVGDGSTTFNVPDLRGRTAIGSGTGTAGGATAHALGSKGGDERLHAHSHDMKHTHTYGVAWNSYYGTVSGKDNNAITLYDNGNWISDNVNLSSPGHWNVDTNGATQASSKGVSAWHGQRTAQTSAPSSISSGTSTGSAGGGGSQNMQPFATVRKLIRAK